MRIANVERNGVPVLAVRSGDEFARKPPFRIRAGDRVDVVIAQIGTLTNPVVAE